MNYLTSAPLFAALSDGAGSLTASVIVSIVIIALGAAAVLLHGRYEDRRQRMLARYRDSRAGWAEALSCSSELLALKSNPGKLVLGQSSFTGESREKYEQALRSWARFIALSEVMRLRLEAADACIEQDARRSWIRLLSFKLLHEAISKLTVGSATVGIDSMPQHFASLRSSLELETLEVCRCTSALTETKSQALSCYLQFVTARKNSETIIQDFEQLIAGEPQRQPGSASLDKATASIVQLKRRLQSSGVQMTLYSKRDAKLAEALALLKRTLDADPLGSHKSLLDDISRKIQRQRRSLNRALELAENCQNYSTRVTKLERRIAEARRTVIPNAAPNERRRKSWLTLDEPDFVIAEKFATTSACARQLEEHLKNSKLISFIRTHQSGLKALDEAEQALDEVLADYNYVTTSLPRLTQAQTEEDRLADESELRQISILYQRQHWHSAKQALLPLVAQQDTRQSTRTLVAGLLQQTQTLANRTADRIEIITEQLDLETTALLRRITGLASQSQNPAAQWTTIQSEAADARQVLSLLSERLATEVADYEAAKELTDTLAAQFSDLNKKTAEDWGGTQAREALAALSKPLRNLTAEAKKSKRDWAAIRRSALTLAEQLTPIRKSVYDEIETSEALARQLRELSAAFKKCQNESYVIEFCQITYGKGLYFATADIAHKLQTAARLLEERNYDDCGVVAEAAAKLLNANHLENWWMTLQMMAGSSEPCAKQFALTCGYVDGGFDAWAKRKAADSYAWTPPPANYHVHAAKNKGDALILLPEQFGEPSIQDYVTSQLSL